MTKPMKTVKYQHTNQTTDAEGNITESTTTREFKIPREEDYIKIYIKHISYLNDLPKGLDDIIYALIQYTTYGNQIIINSSIKRKIAEDLGKSFNTINQYITKLVKNDILIREDTGVYYLNPAIYGKGKWEDILKLRKELEVHISYEDGKYTVSHKHKR